MLFRSLFYRSSDFIKGSASGECQRKQGAQEQGGTTVLIHGNLLTRLERSRFERADSVAVVPTTAGLLEKLDFPDKRNLLRFPLEDVHQTDDGKRQEEESDEAQDHRHEGESPRNG